MRSTTSSKRKRGAAIAGAAMLAEAAGLWVRTGRPGGNIIVRCREGHLYTTLWVPGASVKALRFGWWRFQRCPVGHHWSLVTPVKQSTLTGRERRSAQKHHDIRVP
jgi:hypothetical protein